MIEVTDAQLNAWLTAFMWPLTRILGLIAAAPLFGNVSVTLQIKIGLGVMLALVIAPTIPATPAADLMSLTGLLILAQQFVIGVAMGFAMNIVLFAVDLAGQIAGLSMGFGFATFFDPQTQGQSSAISQFLSLVAIMIFLGVNAHLALLQVLAESFRTMPISADSLGGHRFEQLALWGSRIF